MLARKWLDPCALIDVNVAGAIGIAAVAGGTVALISWGQNALEDKMGHATLPK